MLSKQDIIEHFFCNFPQRWYDPDEVDITIVLGTGKCGTVTMSHLLNASPGMFAYHELSPRLWHLCDRVYRDNCSSSVWDEIYWATRRDVCSVTADNGLSFGEVNNRATFFLPAFKRLFPKAKFIVMWRDFDSCVTSMSRWGIYTKNDRAIDGRLELPDYVTDSRQACAWYWCTLYDFVIEHIDDTNFTVIPFDWLKNNRIGSIQNAFEQIGLVVPQEHEIESILARKHNSRKTNIDVPKIWHEFDDRAEELTSKLRRLEECETLNG